MSYKWVSLKTKPHAFLFFYKCFLFLVKDTNFSLFLFFCRHDKAKQVAGSKRKSQRAQDAHSANLKEHKTQMALGRIDEAAAAYAVARTQ